MKKSITVLLFSMICLSSFGQTDTISTNIYQLNGNLGVGTNYPAEKLTLEGYTHRNSGRTFLKLLNKSTDEHSSVNLKLLAGDNDSFTGLYHHSDTYASSPGFSELGMIWNNGSGLLLKSTGLGIIKFETNTSLLGIERMRIHSNGNIGIGTPEPMAKLQVTDGDIFISDIEKGIIMKSPDERCWRGTVDNFGTLNFVEITCPSLQVSTPETNFDTNTINVYPNPTDNKINIEMDNKQSTKSPFSIFDTTGRKVKTGTIINGNHSIDLTALESGTYILKIYDEKGNTLGTKTIFRL